jgi:hypothetical protein
MEFCGVVDGCGSEVERWKKRIMSIDGPEMGVVKLRRPLVAAG